MPSRRTAYVLLGITVFLWGIAPLMVKFLSGYYNSWTQNAFRFACAAIMLLAWQVIQSHPTFCSGLQKRWPWIRLFCYSAPNLTVGQWRKLALVGGINIVSQSLFAGIYYFLYPAIGILISSLNLVFAALLSFFFLREERASIRSPKFLVGATIALCGIVTVVYQRDPHLMQHLNISEGRFWIGVILALAYALGQAMYIVTVRRIVVDVNPLVSLTQTVWMTAAGLIVLMLINGGIRDLIQQPLWLLPFMALTALVFIVIAHLSIFAALRKVNASVSSAIMQLIPVVTCFFSAAFYGDILTRPQIVGGIAVLFGAWLASLAQSARKKAKLDPQASINPPGR